MTDEKIREYTLRISQSNKTEIVVISYEIILEYIKMAKECYYADDKEGLVKNLKKAKQFVNDLTSNLDLRYGISGELMCLYRYSNQVLLSGIIKRNIEGLEVVEHIMANLKRSFIEVAKADNRGNAIRSSEQVYAGLTYGSNSRLNEICYNFVR